MYSNLADHMDLTLVIFTYSNHTVLLSVVQDSLHKSKRKYNQCHYQKIGFAKSIGGAGCGDRTLGLCSRSSVSNAPLFGGLLLLAVLRQPCQGKYPARHWQDTSGEAVALVVPVSL